MTDEEQEAEHRQVFPDRKCELAGPVCKGVVLVGRGGRQLCTGHITLRDDAEEAGALARQEAWIRQRRVLESKLQPVPPPNGGA